MNKEDWHTRYIERLVTKGEMTYREAKDVLHKWVGKHDHNDNPEDAADEEMSYWRADG